MGSIKEQHKINIHNNHINDNNQNDSMQGIQKDIQAVEAEANGSLALAPAVLTEYEHIEYPKYSDEHSDTSDYPNSALSLEAIAKDQENLETDIETFTALQDKLIEALEAENIKETELALQEMNLVMQSIIANYQARPLQELWQAIFIFFENMKKEALMAKHESSTRGGK